jgi:hypothetical protein
VEIFNSQGKYRKFQSSVLPESLKTSSFSGIDSTGVKAQEIFMNWQSDVRKAEEEEKLQKKMTSKFAREDTYDFESTSKPNLFIKIFLFVKTLLDLGDFYLCEFLI